MKTPRIMEGASTKGRQYIGNRITTCELIITRDNVQNIMDFSSTWKKTKYLKVMSTYLGDRQQQTPGFKYLQVSIVQQQQYFNQRYERKDKDRHSTYTQKPSQGLIRQMLHPDIRDLKDKKQLDENTGLSNFEQRTEDRVLQNRGNYRYSGNKNVQGLGFIRRFSSSFPSHQNCRGVETVSMLQFQLSFQQLQMNAVQGFNGTWNLFEIPPISDRGRQKAKLFENHYLCIRNSDPELGPHNIAARNPVYDNDSARLRKIDLDTQESYDSNKENRVIQIVLEYMNNDNAGNSIPKEWSIEITETIDGSEQ
ncbi:MAG: hypothetical protein EZS28_024315 [Streblomastix strix]|uniref:Uncharacterized protein n=1 Tax=Streblomastix strix TaxID=222440 RepID=A0A5J4VCH0_9EUKA|nr:MAG: hypothetical protein EZS28_024315 [Streblomastix strix]